MKHTKTLLALASPPKVSNSRKVHLSRFPHPKCYRNTKQNIQNIQNIQDKDIQYFIKKCYKLNYNKTPVRDIFTDIDIDFLRSVKHIDIKNRDEIRASYFFRLVKYILCNLDYNITFYITMLQRLNEEAIDIYFVLDENDTELNACPYIPRNEDGKPFINGVEISCFLRYFFYTF